MAFHLHLIHPLQGFIPGAAPQFRQNVSLDRPLGPGPSLHWELDENGRLHACWTLD